MRTSKGTQLTLSPEEVVEALYFGILGRPPELKGLKSHVSRRASFDQDSEWIKAVASNFASSAEFAEKIRLKLFEGSLFVERSQFGEVSLLLRDVLERGFSARDAQRVIVDVGASGREISNTYDLLKHFDFRGILIEANPKQCESIAQDFAGLNVAVVNAAVSATEVDVELWVSDENTHIASLISSRFDDWRAKENFVGIEKDRVFKLKSRRLHDILNENAVPENFFLLSIDIEGMDIPVLNDLLDNTDYRPLYMLVEGKSDSLMNAIPALRTGYQVVASTVSNVLFARMDPSL